jgi:hypothetical protein
MGGAVDGLYTEKKQSRAIHIELWGRALRNRSPFGNIGRCQAPTPHMVVSLHFGYEVLTNRCGHLPHLHSVVMAVFT